MKLTPETIASNEEVDFGPLLEENDDTPPLDVLPTQPIQVTLSSAGPGPAGILNAAVVAYAGPVPPTAPALLASYNKALALGATSDQIAALMGTIRAAKVGEGLTCTVTFGDLDLPPEDNDTCDLTVQAPVPGKPTHLVGDTFGAVRKQA